MIKHCLKKSLHVEVVEFNCFYTFLACFVDCMIELKKFSIPVKALAKLVFCNKYRMVSYNLVSSCLLSTCLCDNY